MARETIAAMVPEDGPARGLPDFWVDDLDRAERALQDLGAVAAEAQPHRDVGLLTMLDPAGHPFCIGTRV